MLWIIIVSVIGSLLFIALCGIFIIMIEIYKKVFYSPIKGQNDEFLAVKNLNYQDQATLNKATTKVNEILKTPYEDLVTKSYDGLKLHAYFYKSEGSKDYIIFFHGYRRTARRSFSGLTMDSLKENENVIVVDMRAHGQSKGHTITFGKKEQRDVVTWIKYAKKNFGEDIKITIVGVSLGASVVLMAADKIDEDIKIIADSPYMSTKDVFIDTMSKYRRDPTVFYPLSNLTSTVFCHCTLNFGAASSIDKSKNKILIIYGTADVDIVRLPIEEVYERNKDHVQIETFEGVDHGLSYLRDTERYRKIFFDFINE